MKVRQVTEPQVEVTLTGREATVLLALMGRVSGVPRRTCRNVTHKLSVELRRLGYQYGDGEDVNPFFVGEVQAIGDPQ